MSRDNCGEPCPLHGSKCPVCDPRHLTPEERESNERLNQVMCGSTPPEDHDIHLCLSDPRKPHTWKTGETADQVRIRLDN